MVITLSERRLSELIRQLEGIADSDSEIAFRMQHFASRIFKHVADCFGIKMVGLLEHQGDIGSFQFDISGVGMDRQSGGFKWDKLQSGLNFLNVLAVTVEEKDIEEICSGPVCTAMMDSWDHYAHTLQRLSVAEIQPAVERACLEYAWKPRPAPDYTGVPALDAELQYDLDTAQLQRAGLKNPLEKVEAIEAYRRAEEAAYAAQEAARLDRITNGE